MLVDLSALRGYTTRDRALGALASLGLDPHTHRALVAVADTGRFVPVVVTCDLFAIERCARSGLSVCVTRCPVPR
jgi:hypothetical protein